MRFSKFLMCNVICKIGNQNPQFVILLLAKRAIYFSLFQGKSAIRTFEDSTYEINCNFESRSRLFQPGQKTSVRCFPQKVACHLNVWISAQKITKFLLFLDGSISQGKEIIS